VKYALKNKNKTQNKRLLIKIVKYANTCKINFRYFEYKHETDFYIRMEAIRQSKKNKQNHKYPNPIYKFVDQIMYSLNVALHTI